MRKVFVTLLGANLLSAPAYAREWRDQSVGIKPGVFLGAKLRLSLGESAVARPRAGFAIAPTRSRVSGDGMLSTNIGEGIGLNLGFGAKSTLTLAGFRADQALGLTSGPAATYGPKLGLSDGAKIAIGVTAALLAGAGVLYVVKSNECDECDD